jgi:hypothetical protein
VDAAGDLKAAELAVDLDGDGPAAGFRPLYEAVIAGVLLRSSRSRRG